MSRSCERIEAVLEKERIGLVIIINLVFRESCPVNLSLNERL